MFSINHRRRSSSVSRRGRQVPITEQLEVRALMTSWVGQIGGAGYDSTYSRAIMDTDGNTYVGGTFSGVADFNIGVATTPTTTLTSLGGEDGYVAKYDPNGTLRWARRFGGVDHEDLNSIRQDAVTGFLYVTGSFRASADFTGDGVADLTSVGASDAFVVRLDPKDGTSLWYKAIGGSSQEIGKDVAAADGNVYVVGTFASTTDFNPGTGVNTLTPAGKGKLRSSDGYLLKLTDQGSYVSAWQIGGSSSDSLRSLVVDGSTIYVAGNFGGTADLNPSSAVQNRTSNGAYDAFFASYSTSGSLNWVQTIGGPGTDGGDWRLSSDANSLYLSGYISETVDLDPGVGVTNLTTAGGSDALIAKYTKSAGTLEWARSFGSTGTDDARIEVVVNPLDSSMYLGGVFSGTVDFNPGSGNGGELTSAGVTDGMLLKLDASGNFLNAWRTGGTGVDGAVKPIGIIGTTLYATGRFEATADFPTGALLTSYGSADGFLLALDEAVPAPSPLLAAAVPTKSVEQSLPASGYQPIVAESLRRWEAAGVDTSALSGMTVQVRNLGGTTLGLASGNTIWLDDNAAGWGWFVDSTLGNSSEFSRAGNQGERNRMDLLTVVMHEIGHLLGQDHTDDGVMAETLAASVRRTEIPFAHTALVDQLFSQLDAQQTGSLLDGLLDEQRNSRRPWLKRRR